MKKCRRVLACMSRGTDKLTHSLTNPFVIASCAEMVYAALGRFWPLVTDFVSF